LVQRGKTLPLKHIKGKKNEWATCKVRERGSDHRTKKGVVTPRVGEKWSGEGRKTTVRGAKEGTREGGESRGNKGMLKNRVGFSGVGEREGQKQEKFGGGHTARINHIKKFISWGRGKEFIPGNYQTKRSKKGENSFKVIEGGLYALNFLT